MDESVVYSFIFLASLILAPLLVQIRGWMPAALFFTAAIVYAIFGVVGFATAQIVLSQVQESEPAHYGSYYVVSHSHFAMSLGIAMALLGAITWVQTRFGAMRHPKLTKVLFWFLHIALIVGNSFQSVLAFILPAPRRYTDYPEFFETYVLVSSWSGITASASVLGLVGLLIWSAIATWRF
ncbi:cbb3-type cytochrome c oxidase subunit I [Ruegeria sp. 2205SS24-7]|uniref:cbb3-type cytochrome c oxidase subunit I n=1 Tax=Ruegeria discodermiae TaxID=3064389 RepID=UPI00274098DD|nr:cbb3-type cytochrome c oxidase subunit I [Ruegeria sp. 2205SS24-7]MDP5217139.1 cbb3-type cytochrome c oxidase subunit I [Ruegeria sp. 2205SS24-7]